MTSQKLLQQYRAEILRLAAQYGAHNIRVFGSAARAELEVESDIDLLVEMESGRCLLDLIGLIQDLEGLLGRKVDVVEEEGLHWFIRDRVLSEAIPL